MLTFAQLRRIAHDTATTLVGAIGFLGQRQASLLAAGLAFFALISLAPFVILAVAIGGAIFGPEATREELRLQIGDDLGPGVTDFVLSLAEGAANRTSLSVASIVGAILLFWSSTRLFAEVRTALHAIWNLAPPPRVSFRVTLLRFLKARLFAALGTLFFGAIFLALLGSRLILTAIFGSGPSSLPWGLVSVLEVGFAIALFTAVVYSVYRFLPTRGPRGKALLVGSFITAVLLILGRSVVGLYVSVGAISSIYGAAGALIIFLIWAYWSALAFLFGARLTHDLRVSWGGDAPREPT